MILTRGVSLTNFFVAGSALGFQAFVLYPWHKRLYEDFEALKQESLQTLQAHQGVTIKQQLNGRRAESVESSVLPSTTPDAVYVAKQSATSTADMFSGIRQYTRYALAGAVCCSFTHAVLTPVDVVKTKIQIQPGVYNRGLYTGLQHAVAQDGARSLLKGLGPTVAGYFLQGAFKFGVYELFKQQAMTRLGEETASNSRYAIYLTSAAAAECLGSIALCPFEAVRIRLVSEPTFGRGLCDGFSKMAKQEGMRGFYSGLGPIWFKQVPYTVVTFMVYEKATELAYSSVDKSTLPEAAVTAISLVSGLVAGIAAALVSQPADTTLSKINMEKGPPGEGQFRRVGRTLMELGIRGSYAGIRARIVMVGSMTAVQFGIYNHIKKFMGAT